MALSWTWGLGLFFSVQMAMHYGLAGLLGFAIPNAIGLFLFGALTQVMARRYPEGKAFEKHFFGTGKGMGWVFLAYQLVALSLTFFAVLKYFFDAVGVDILLASLLILGTAVMLGEQFDIPRIRISHSVIFVLLLLAMVGIVLGTNRWLSVHNLQWGLAAGESPVLSLDFLGLFVPIVVGLIAGPWLDIQQWQRAIQIHREKGSVRASYLFGSVLFFGIIFFHGIMALVIANGALAINPEVVLSSEAADKLFHAKATILKVIANGDLGLNNLFSASYFTFLVLCVLTTLDSGYVALRWYLKHLVSRSESIVLTLVPATFLASPMLMFALVVLVAIVSVPLGMELEYFMSFYASFCVGYAVVFAFRSMWKPEFASFTPAALFAVAAFSVGLFGLGYFNQWWVAMLVGSVIPLAHGLIVISSRAVVDDLQKALPRPDSTDAIPMPSVSGKAAEVAVHALEAAIKRLDPKAAEKVHAAIQRLEPTAAHALATVLDAIQVPLGGTGSGQGPTATDHAISVREHADGFWDGKWFQYSFLATYQDTNSVGNVYFGQYVLWVGKVREMFFRMAMPGFDLKTTPFYILTRSIEHKFNMESREFEFITVKIRVSKVNRKFTTLEHEIWNSENKMLGSGHQVLLYVNSSDYQIRDLPNEVKTAFLPYLAGTSVN